MDLNRRSEGSEAYDILHLVEGMKDEHVSEAPDRTNDKAVDQAPEGMNSLVLTYRDHLAKADFNDPAQVEELRKMLLEIHEQDPEQAKTLEQEWADKNTQ